MSHPVHCHAARRAAHVLLSRSALAAAILLPRTATSQAVPAYDALRDFADVLRAVQLHHVDSTESPRLVRAAIDGMLRSLDPFSRFVPRAAVARAVALERGDLGTVGLTLDLVDGLVTVLTVVRGGPADRHGVMPGDRVLAVDDTIVSTWDPQMLELHLARPAGTQIGLELARGPRLEPERYRVRLRTRRMPTSTVSVVHRLDDTTGYVRLAAFGAEAAARTESAVRRLVRDGATRLVLDLRGNPGGQVIAAVDVASLFLPRRTLVFRTRGRERITDQDYATGDDGPFRDLPLVVLIDAQSASAAEALAASLQDHDRAVLVGHPSFGKALIQRPFPLPDGGVVWLTTGWVHAPGGRSIQRPYAVWRFGEEQQRPGVADSQMTYRTDNGRPVRGGGGVVPDVVLPAAAAVPVWYATAAEAGLDVAVADSVAATLPGSATSLAQWTEEPLLWESAVVEPFLVRVRASLAVEASLAPGPRALLARRLAARVVEVRWGADARDGFVLRQDEAVRAGMATFPERAHLLAPSGN